MSFFENKDLRLISFLWRLDPWKYFWKNFQSTRLWCARTGFFKFDIPMPLICCPGHFWYCTYYLKIKHFFCNHSIYKMYMHIQQHMLWHQYALYIFEPNKYYHYSINVVNISMYLTWVSIDLKYMDSWIKLIPLYQQTQYSSILQTSGSHHRWGLLRSFL